MKPEQKPDQFKHSPEWMLRSALQYIGAHYGATLAHHLLGLALRRLKEEHGDSKADN
jgi:hypothetical protein